MAGQLHLRRWRGSSTMRLKFLSVVACLLLYSGTQLTALHAQTNTGTIEGTVNDTAGRPLSNVMVQLTDPATDQKWTTTTDTNGFYCFPGIPTGRYRITTGTPGAAGAPPAPPPPPAPGAAPTPATTYEYEATPGGPVVVNLTVATPRTDNILSAEAVPIRTAPASIQHTYNTQTAQYWPRSNFMSTRGQLFGTYNDILISEGLTSGDIFAAGPAVNGQPPIGNNFRINGIDNNNKASPGPLTYIPNFATESTSLFYNQAVPVFGHSIGGQTDLALRTGANEFHGSVYDFVQASQLSAMDQAAARQGFTNKPSYTQNRMGLQLAFPIARNKTFFTFNLEYVPLNASSLTTGSSLVPTAAGFSTLEGLGGVSTTNLNLLRLATRVQPGNAVTTTTVGGATIPLGFATPLVSNHLRQYFGTASLDFTPISTDTVHLRYVQNRVTGDNLGNLQTVLPTVPASQSLVSLVASVSWAHVFNSGPLNDLRLAYNRLNRTLGQTTQFGTLAGFANFPSIGISGDTNLMIGPPAIPAYIGFNTWQISDVFSVNRGRHRFDVGFDGLRYRGVITNNPGFNGGTFGFSSLGRFLQDLPPDVFAFQGFGASRIDDRRFLFEWFAQDRFQLMPNLMITAGVRYQYNPNAQSLQEQSNNAIASIPGVINFAAPNTQKSAVAPYFGFAFTPAGSTRTVVRGSFGMNYQSLIDPRLLTPFSSFSPQLGTLIAGTNLGNTPGFLAHGGLTPAATPSFGLNQAQARALTSAFTPNDQKLPYSMQWNLALQQALWSGFTAELKYLGSRDVNLPFVTTLNTPVGTGAFGSGAPVTALTAQGQALTSSGFTNPIFTVQPFGLSRYNAAAVNLNQRLAGGMQLLANYTWSHDYATATGSILDTIFGRQLTDTLWDRRHRASIGWVYDVASAFKNTNSIARNIFANFALSGSFVYEWPARLPVLALTGSNINGVGVSPTLFTGTGTPPGTTSSTLGFTPLPPGSPGTIQNAISLSPVNNINLGIAKRFSFHDREAIEVRGEAFNIVNHPQYTYAPITALNATSFGQVPGFLNFTNPVVPNLLVPGSVNFNDPSRFFSSNPRVFQLSARFTW